MRMTVAGVGAIIVPRKGEAQPKVSTPQLIVGFIILALIIGVPAYLIYNFFFREGAPTVPEFQRVENEIMVSASEVQSTSTFTYTGEPSKEMRRYVDYHYGNNDGNLAEDEVNGFLTALETKERQKIQTEYTFINGESGQITEVDYYVISCPFGSIDTLGDFVFGLRETISWALEGDEHTYSKTGLGGGDVIYFSVPTGWKIESVDGLSSESMSPDQRTVTGVAITDTVNITFRKPEVNEPPTASASANPTSGVAPLQVSFTGSGTDPDGSIVSYHWDFDDGSTSDTQNPSRTFHGEGTFIVTLTVIDDDGATATDTITITTSQNIAPTASASANPTSGEVPLTVSFTGSGADEDGTIESYYWDFDDGTTSNEQNPTHTFNNGGTYNATLTVTDDKEATGTDKVTISVSQVSWIKRMRYTAMTSYYYNILDLYSEPYNRSPDEFIENYYTYNEVFSNAFDIQGNKLKIEYAAMGSSDGGALSIFVYDSTDTEIHWEPILVYLLDEGSFEVNVDSGTYYLIFGTEYMEYVSVDVYDWS